MASPYRNASLRPFDLFSERFRKKLTVIGIIGHTQGVNKASNPPKSPAIKINQSEALPALDSGEPNDLSSPITGVQ